MSKVQYIASEADLNNGIPIRDRMIEYQSEIELQVGDKISEANSTIGQIAYRLRDRVGTEETLVWIYTPA